MNLTIVNKVKYEIKKSFMLQSQQLHSFTDEAVKVKRISVYKSSTMHLTYVLHVSLTY